MSLLRLVSPLSGDEGSVKQVLQTRDQTVDEISVSALQTGDPAEIEFALRVLLPKLQGWLYRLIGNASDLEDAVQDALIELSTALANFRGDSKITTYAHAVAVRVAYRYFRKKKKRSEFPSELPPESGIFNEKNDLEQRYIQREAIARLKRCIERLPEKRRVAFILCAVEGLKPNEAAQVVGISSEAMRTRLKHSRREILRLIRGDSVLEGFVMGDKS
ncbi:MAG: RNA polymerase sigma factor [Myxococcales bacterium]|nr:MAG: RNA polymerase sigma factor [Myxococcales bacterium]